MSRLVRAGKPGSLYVREPPSLHPAHQKQQREANRGPRCCNPHSRPSLAHLGHVTRMPIKLSASFSEASVPAL